MHVCMYVMYAYAQIYGVGDILYGYYLTAEHCEFLFTPKCSTVLRMIGLL